MKSTTLHYLETNETVTLRVGDKIEININDKPIVETIVRITEDSIDGEHFDLTYFIIDQRYKLLS